MVQCDELNMLWMSTGAEIIRVNGVSVSTIYRGVMMKLELNHDVEVRRIIRRVQVGCVERRDEHVLQHFFI